MDNIHLEKSGKPLYIQIRDHYKNRILNGELCYGDRIDSEMTIQKLFDVSRITARQAISDLEKEGLVSRGRGKGTFVCYQPVHEENGIDGFTQNIKMLGKEPGTFKFDIQKIMPDPELLEIFHMVSCKPVYCFKRIRTIDDVRVCYMINYFPGDLSIPSQVEEYDESVLEKLVSKGITPSECTEEYSAMLPDSSVCRELAIRQDIPILCKRRRSLDDKGRVIEYSITYYRGDLYTHRISKRPYTKD